MTAHPAASVQTFRSPSTIAEAIAAKVELGPEAMFLAGGTDLGVRLRRRILEPVHLIGLGRVEALRTLERDGGEIRVGASVSHGEIEGSPLFSSGLEALQEACRTVGSVQTRAVGTIGGNLCNASPAADTPPVLMALGASVELEGSGGSRVLTVDEFMVGYRRTALRDGELLTAVRIPAGRRRTGSAFLKLGRRRAMEISIVCVGVRIDLSDDGAIAAAGIGLGSVAATTVRARRAEQDLCGALPSPEAFRKAGVNAVDACDPIDDVRATAGYRRAMVPVLVARALAIATNRAAGGGG